MFWSGTCFFEAALSALEGIVEEARPAAEPVVQPPVEPVHRLPSCAASSAARTTRTQNLARTAFAASDLFLNGRPAQTTDGQCMLYSAIQPMRLCAWNYAHATKIYPNPIPSRLGQPWHIPSRADLVRLTLHFQIAVLWGKKEEDIMPTYALVCCQLRSQLLRTLQG